MKVGDVVKIKSIPGVCAKLPQSLCVEVTRMYTCGFEAVFIKHNAHHNFTKGCKYLYLSKDLDRSFKLV